MYSHLDEASASMMPFTAVVRVNWYYVHLTSSECLSAGPGIGTLYARPKTARNGGCCHCILVYAECTLYGVQAMIDATEMYGSPELHLGGNRQPSSGDGLTPAASEGRPPDHWPTTSRATFRATSSPLFKGKLGSSRRGFSAALVRSLSIAGGSSPCRPPSSLPTTPLLSSRSFRLSSDHKASPSCLVTPFKSFPSSSTSAVPVDCILTPCRGIFPSVRRRRYLITF